MFHQMTHEQWKEIIDTNLHGVFNMIDSLWSSMRDCKFGYVITISLINDQKGQAGQANYSASKAGDVGLTEYWHKKVHVLASPSTPSALAT